MARPGFLFFGGTGEEGFLALDDQVRASVLPDLDGTHLAAERERHELHPVADAERGNVQVEERRVYPRRAVFVDTVRAAGEDYAFRLTAPDLLYRSIVRDQLGVDAGLTDPPRDELGVLPAEVED